MNKFLVLVLLIPSAACLAASEQPTTEPVTEEKEITVEWVGDIDSAELQKTLSSIESEPGNTNVFVTVDDEGNVNIKKMTEENESHHMPGKKMHKMMKHEIHKEHKMMPMMPMNKATANCVLKHLKQVNTDGAAHLLHKACSALNPDN